MKQNMSVQKGKLYAISLFILLIMETAFGNTPLQVYNLMVDRIFFITEVVLFVLFLTMEKYTPKFIALLMGVLLLFVGSYLFINATILLKMFMFSMVIAKLEIRKAFEILFKFRTVILMVVIVLALVGIIPNEYEKVEKGIGVVYGYGLGYTHPNRLASAICCILLCYIGWKKEQLRRKNIFIIGVVTLISYCITKSRTFLYCMMIFYIFYFIYEMKLTKKIASKISSIMGIISIPLCISISVVFPILLMVSSGRIQEIVYGINLLFSRRFTHIEHMFMTYPVTLLGGVFDVSKMENIFSYSVVDNGYVRFLYQYGVIGLVIFGIFSVVSFAKVKKKEDYIWKVIFIIVAIEGVLENIYVDISLNLLVVFWAELFSTRKGGKIKNYDF